jgi:starch-binding outer membrane protein, SusD/RagB family
MLKVKLTIMKIKFKYILSVMLAFALLAGCSKSVLEETPPNILSGPTILKNYNGFEAALNGLYNLARYARWQSEKLENALNGVDNMCSNSKRSDIFWNWTTSNSPSDVDLLQTWQWLYEMINASNTIIYYSDQNVDWRGGSDTPENNKLRVVAEARAIRAWAYRRLTYSWGDVPLVLTMPQAIKTDWERAPIADVRKAAISDYKFAQQYIPTEASLQGRMTKGACQTLLAEMYLTVGKPDSALYWCDQVISNPAYKLTTARYGVKASDPLGSPFGDMFKEGNQNREQGNKEALWVFQFELFNSIDEQGHQLSRAEVGSYNSISVKGTDGKSVSPVQYTVERGGRGKAYFGPTKWWVDSYELKKDDRAQNYILRTSFRIQTQAENNIGYTGTGTLPADKIPVGFKVGDTIWCKWSQDITAARFKVNEWPYSRKAEGTSTADVQADYAWTDQIYIRLADTYLLRAEAKLKLNNLQGAADDINVIRNRSKATPVTAAQVTMNYILDERSRELFIEEERRMTLLRTQTWFTRTQLYNKFGGERITLRDTLFPIPQDVIDANLTKAFPQNPGF